MSIVIDQHLDPAKWRAFVDNHPQGNVFHTPEMFQVYARTPGHRPAVWAATDNGGQVLALLLPVQITLKDGLLRRLTTRAVSYGSVLYDPSPKGKEALKTLLHTYAREADRQALFTEMRNLSDLSAVQPLLNECGFAYEAHLNFLVDLDRSNEAVMQGISKRTRKKIRRGQRREALVVEEVTRKELDRWYAVLQETYEIVQVPLAHRSLFEAAFDLLGPLGMVRFVAARVNGEFAAVSAELIYKETIYGWYGGTDRAYSKYYPNELLTWHILEWGVKNGYRLYDFGGAGKPDEDYGVRDFKAKFGGDLVCFGRNTRVHAPFLLRLSRLGYGIYRRLAYLT
jgi:CelD/BcsL family acetyltransferase involved in cellulose biosynthesis